MNLFDIIEIDYSDYQEIPESLGTKEKFWIEKDGEKQLLKFGRAGTGEDWAEKAACEISRLLEIPHAHYELANCHGRSCVLSPTFVPPDARLILGNEIISRVAPAYVDAKTYQQREHTVSRILAALTVFTRPNHMIYLSQFIGYLMLDGLIGNTDRHHENWGLIVNANRTVELAPSFDHASSLGRELTDERRASILSGRDPRVTTSAFCSRARSALYDAPGDKRPLHPIAAFHEAGKLPRSGASAWLDKLSSIKEDDFREVFHQIPRTAISEIGATFAIEILKENQRRLLELRP